MIRSYKYRIYPNSTQTRELNYIFYICRNLYNATLQERISYYRKYHKSTSYKKQASELPETKTLYPELKEVHSQVTQQVLKQVDTAFKNFFRRLKTGEKPGFPRYKSVDRSFSICFPQPSEDLSTLRGIKLTSKKLQVFGISGYIKVILHRPFQGRCKQVRIKKEHDKFYLILTCDDVPKERHQPTGKSIAIDLGLINFLATDTGRVKHHPKPYKTSKEKLAYLQRRLAKKQKGSNNSRKLKKQIGRQHTKISNIRHDYLHKVSKKLVKNNDVIFLEDLNIKAMLEDKTSNVDKSNIQDASWGSFVKYIEYKAESAGALVIKVLPQYTSKTCSKCGSIKYDLVLSDRTFHCISCRKAMERDVNAAKNIRRLGTKTYNFCLAYVIWEISKSLKIGSLAGVVSPSEASSFR